MYRFSSSAEVTVTHRRKYFKSSAQAVVQAHLRLPSEDLARPRDVWPALFGIVNRKSRCSILLFEPASRMTVSASFRAADSSGLPRLTDHSSPESSAVSTRAPGRRRSRGFASACRPVTVSGSAIAMPQLAPRPVEDCIRGPCVLRCGTMRVSNLCIGDSHRESPRRRALPSS